MPIKLRGVLDQEGGEVGQVAIDIRQVLAPEPADRDGGIEDLDVEAPAQEGLD
jgi:hypothetical protein